MTSLKPIEWLALQRCYFAKPKKGLDAIRAGDLSGLKPFLEKAKKDLAYLERFGLDLIAWDQPRYPKILKEIYDPPLVLLAKGNFSPWEENPWVAVVGARKATLFGRERVAALVPELVNLGIGIVSGLAFGIDAFAHQACVDAGGKTWGVLGSGMDHFYPVQNKPLAELMLAKGGTLSEFPLGSTVYRGNFPQRNRIISGLSQAVIIVEATLKSGSLITARYALEQGREVFVVPPPREHVAYEGSQKLLEEGATPFESGEQVLEAIQNLLDNGGGTMDHGPWTRDQGPRGRDYGPWTMDQGQKTEDEARRTRHAVPILSLLIKPQTLDFLAAKTKKGPTELLSELLLLESEGLIKKMPGALWQSL